MILRAMGANVLAAGFAAPAGGAPLAYLPNEGSATISVVDTASNGIVVTIPVGRRPWNMALTPDGAELYVACGRSNTVAVIDTSTNRKTAEIPVGELPWGVVIR